MIKNNKKIAFLLVAALIGSTIPAGARPNIGSRPGIEPQGQALKTTAATCKAAEAAIDLDINNIRARLMTGGDMWWDIGTQEARYEVPKGSRKQSLFAGSVWIGGTVQGQLKVAAQTYRQDGNDYWPGPLDNSGSITQDVCSDWDRFWKVNKETINRFKDIADKSSVSGDADYQAIFEWPAKGNKSTKSRNQTTMEIPDDKDYAPFIDIDNNGIYDPTSGDYPGYPETGSLPGDQFIWWVFNDKGNIKQQTKTEGIGIEVQASAFAYSSKDFLNDATFYNYRLINRGNLTLDSTYIATWTDADLGWYKDDYIGCDTTRGLGILYNGKSVDGSGQINSYGEKVPMVGIDFFKGPLKPYDSNGKTLYKQLSMEAFTYYNNDASVIGNPNNGIQIYNYMTGSISNGERFSNDFAGPGVNSKGYGAGHPLTKYVFYGDPSNNSEWSECACNNNPDDRRFVHSSGPFKLFPGVVSDITIGAVWVSDVGGCPNTSFKKIRVADDGAQSLFENNFQTIEGPEAPRMVVRELDRKMIFYLVNDTNSTNYQEKFGYDPAKRYRVVSNKAAKLGNKDSLYKFEGYRVFQLASSDVQPAQIFNERGEVDNTKAIEVFQTDVKNGVVKIINYDKNTEVSDSTFEPVVKVSGKDSGIRHSFELTIDQFSKTSDKRFVNYRNYYFVAIAYAYNNFSPFSDDKADSTQDLPYLESSHGANSSKIQVVIAMPNPSNGDVGSVLNADYGDGVIITRLEGSGNGGREVRLSQASQEEAMGASSIAEFPTYEPGYGPIDVKVIDPVRIKPAKWELMIKGTTTEVKKGLDSNSTWTLVNTTTQDTIYSEKNISTQNEQILEKYGLQVSVKQTIRPGDDQITTNGYISSDIIFASPAVTWLGGVVDGEQKDPRNWIRSGRNNDTSTVCNYNDVKWDTVTQVYEKLLSNYSFTRGTWAPYSLGAEDKKCPFGTVETGTGTGGIGNIHSVDIVFTSDVSKWTKCVVLEMQEKADLAEGRVTKFNIRSHASWNGELDGDRPVYSTVAGDTGKSLFPGYAINQETGERLNIVFGEDSWLRQHNGNDMLWNPSQFDIVTDGTQTADYAQKVYGGKHVIYISGTKYDEGKAFVAASTDPIARNNELKKFMYTGFPLLRYPFGLLPASQGFIPTETRIKIRVQRPYVNFPTTQTGNGGNPHYSFSTDNLAPTALSDNANMDKATLLDRIFAVPNPYYAYAGYELNRLDTRVRIINLPKRATINIYSLDGTLITRLEKDNPNVSYVDWNVRNSKGLPIASGMYLMHVKAEGIGETVIRWFGAMRPIDITTY